MVVSWCPCVGWSGWVSSASVGLALVRSGMAHSLWTVATCLAVAGLGISCAAVALLTIVQVHAPVETRGRVLALWSLAFTGLTPLSYALAGLVGERLGAHGIILLGGVCVLGAAGFGLLSRPMRQLA